MGFLKNHNIIYKYLNKLFINLDINLCFYFFVNNILEITVFYLYF